MPPSCESSPVWCIPWRLSRFCAATASAAAFSSALKREILTHRIVPSAYSWVSWIHEETWMYVAWKIRYWSFITEAATYSHITYAHDKEFSELRKHLTTIWRTTLLKKIDDGLGIGDKKAVPVRELIPSMRYILQITMQKMVSNVSQPDLVQKMTTDHRSHRLGEFREMVRARIISILLDIFVLSHYCPHMPRFMIGCIFFISIK